MQQTGRLVFSMGLKSAAQCSLMPFFWVQPSSHHVIAITLAKPWLGVKKIMCEGQRQRDRLDQYWHIPFSDEQLTSSHIPFRQPFWQSVQTWNSGAAKLWPSIILHHVMLLVITYGASHSIPGLIEARKGITQIYTACLKPKCCGRGNETMDPAASVGNLSPTLHLDPGPSMCIISCV